MRILFAVAAIIFAWSAHSAVAHPDYVMQAQDWIAPDGTRYQVALLYGDGIFGPDPIRPIVLNADGKVVAVGPLASEAILSCDDAKSCRALLVGERFLRSEPKPEDFLDGVAPDFYVSSHNKEYGFTDTPMTLSDHVRFQVGLIRRYAPFLLVSGLAAFFYSAFFLPARMFERRAPKRRVLSVALRSLGVFVLALALVLIAIFLFMLGLWPGIAMLVVFAAVSAACARIHPRIRSSPAT